LIARLVFYPIDPVSFCRSIIYKSGAFLAEFVGDFVCHQDTDLGGQYEAQGQKKRVAGRASREIEAGQVGGQSLVALRVYIKYGRR
jgi:hypothetical protein